MAKSRDAFRTISEVADWLDTPAHVLRFWESKFSQVKPVKRAGGRRYYRPADMELLGGIKKLLHDEGMTIKGVQKVLREQGVKHVAALSEPVEDDGIIADAPFIEAHDTSETVVPFAPLDAIAERSSAPEHDGSQQDSDMSLDDEALSDADADEPGEPVSEPKHLEPMPEMAGAQDRLVDTDLSDPAPEEAGFEAETEAEPTEKDTADAALPVEPDNVVSKDVTAQADDSDTDAAEAESHFAEDTAHSPLPAFLKEPLAASDATHDSAANEPGHVPLPQLPDLDAIVVAPGALTALASLTWLSTKDAEMIAPVLAELRDLQQRLTSPRR